MDIAKTFKENPREFKFKAWDDLHKKMFDVATINKGYIEVITHKDVYHHQALVEKNRMCLQEMQFFGNDIVILQYTGFKDKNGVEIYEGDICEYKTGERVGGVYSEETVFKGFIRFDAGQFEIGNHNGYGGEWEGLCYLLGSYHKKAKDFKVIGNVFEHPDKI